MDNDSTFLCLVNSMCFCYIFGVWWCKITIGQPVNFWFIVSFEMCLKVISLGCYVIKFITNKFLVCRLYLNILKDSKSLTLFYYFSHMHFIQVNCHWLFGHKGFPTHFTFGLLGGASFLRAATFFTSNFIFWWVLTCLFRVSFHGVSNGHTSHFTIRLS